MREPADQDGSGNEVQSARTGISPRLVEDLTAQKERRHRCRS